MEWYLGELRLFAFGVVPAGWALCNGALLPLQRNQALYSLLGIQFGGDGRTNFALPDLRDLVAVGAPNPAVAGATGGEVEVKLVSSQMPVHQHGFQASINAGSDIAPNNVVFAASGSHNLYAVQTTSTPLVQLAVGSVETSGGGAAHSNLQPYLAMQWCIAIQGVFPSRP